MSFARFKVEQKVICQIERKSELFGRKGCRDSNEVFADLFRDMFSIRSICLDLNVWMILMERLILCIKRNPDINKTIRTFTFKLRI